jgi:hypothetical protein
MGKDEDKMIEKFTPEELEIIKRELGMTNDIENLSKKFVLQEQKKKVDSIFPERYTTDEELGYVTPSNDIMNAVIAICDHIHKNYSTRLFGGKFRRSTKVYCDRTKYKADMDELIVFIENMYKRVNE